MPETKKTGQGIPSPFPPPVQTQEPQPETELPPPPSDDDLPPLPPEELDEEDSGPEQPGQAADYSAYVAKTVPSMDYFASGQFDKSVAEYRQFGKRKTGYANLDAVQPFYPGLYVLGAISSLGKTTFVHQLADQLAAMGEDVLYFSLEQSEFELFSKSLSREFYRAKIQMMQQGKNYPAYTSMQIRRGDAKNATPMELQDVTDDYTGAVQNRLNIVPCNFSVTVETITVTVSDWIMRTGRKPVVVIDYLQIVSPSLVNGRIPDTKTSIDHIVHAIKSFQSLLNLTVIVISSLNRQNYLTPIDFESFKESGGIEYTADVVWGLQLAILETDDFNLDGKKEASVSKKRERIREAKAKDPRDIQLVCLKNRYGIPSYNAYFHYHPAYDMFAAAYGSKLIPGTACTGFIEPETV